jgi:hypothetical protein
MATEKELISLKEAAKLSGYSADYVGQLIRAGKISGKQVFSSVAWMTTEEAVVEYVQKEKKGVTPEEKSVWESIRDRILTPEFLVSMYSGVSWVVIVLLGLFILGMYTVFVVSVDHRITQTYQQKAIDLSTH